MIDDLFAPFLPNFAIQDLHQSDHALFLVAVSQATTASCPDCHTSSSRIHSRYQRHLKDLPWSGQPVHLSLLLHRFFCVKAACPHKTFAEPLPDLAPRFARRTARLTRILEQLSLAVGGEAGARLASMLAFPTSPATLLRLLRQLPVPTITHPRVIGIDDWAYRRGQRYGTIITDLEHHRPIDLLRDRTTASTLTWLQNHPSVQIISRDRGGVYAEAARLGAPQARQVADRWHLLRNLGDALELLFSRHLARHHQRLTQQVQQIPTPTTQNVEPRSFSDPEKIEQRRQARLARYEQVVALAEQGMNRNRIAHTMQMSATTVENWLARGHFPERPPRPPRPRPVPTWLPYALQRWQEGRKSMLAIYREVQAQGYQGSYWSIYTYLSSLRTRADALPQAIPMTLPSPRQARSLFLQRPQELTGEQQRSLRLLTEQDPVWEEIYALVQRFTTLIRLRMAEPLQDWLKQVEASQFRELHSFARGIRQDWDAVVAGLSLPWSQGQTEGQITRLKLIKRQMYGRAHFDLLRHRVLSVT